MPTVNIYFKNRGKITELEKLTPSLKTFLAKKLTCGDIKLTSSELSVRFIKINGGEMIGEIELELTAHAFPERIKKQDLICLETMEFLQEKSPSLGNVKVWLKLCQLGHSWEETGN